MKQTETVKLQSKPRYSEACQGNGHRRFKWKVQLVDLEAHRWSGYLACCGTSATVSSMPQPDVWGSDHVDISEFRISVNKTQQNISSKIT